MSTDMLTRAAPIAGTADETARTVEIVFASEQPVKRYSWEEGGYYLEVLEVTAGAIDRTRLEAGMSLLDSHRATSMDNRLGSVVPGSFRIASGKALCRVKFSRSERAELIWRDILDGHTVPVSVGYRIDESKKAESSGNALPTITATRWTPLEVSLVPIPADASAGTRAEEDVMPENQTTERHEPQQRPAPANIIAERTRVKELRALARSAGMDDAELDAAIDAGTAVATFRERAFESMIARQNQSPTFPHVPTHGGEGADREFTARQDALVARMTGKPPEGEARHFMATPLLDHARGLLETRGVRTHGMSREQVLGYSARDIGPVHATSNFPLLLQGAGERVLQEAYRLAQSPLKTLLGRQSTAADFRAKSKLKISDIGLLEELSESGEITNTTRTEASESYRIKTYARIFSLSFRAIVNDDLGAFADWAVQAGRVSAETENKVLQDLLLEGSGAGPVMNEDSKRLFHADHGNLAAAGTALDETNLGAAILAFRKQKGLTGRRITVPPRYLLVGPELEMAAQKLVATISPATTDNAVPEAIKNLVPVVEPNLDSKSWYLFADPAAMATLEWSYLSGHEGVQVDTRDGFRTLGTEFRAVLHFGAGAIDFRGAYRNPGL